MERLTPYVEATVVRAQSPTSVRAGDSAKVSADGTIDGFVGGACAEASVRLYALRSLQSGDPVLLRILPSGAEGEPAVEDGAVTVRNPCLSGGALEVFLKPQLPAATLRVVGTTRSPRRWPTWAGGSATRSSRGRPRPASRAQTTLPSWSPRTGTTRSGSSLRLFATRSPTWASSPARDAATPSGSRSTSRTSSAVGCTLRRDSRSGLDTPEEIALSILAEVVALRPSDAAARRLLPGEPTRAEAAQPAAVSDSDTEPEPTAPVEVALDPVCGMEVALSPASIQLERDGERFYFCSEGCRDSFAAEGAHGAAVG